MSDLILKKSWHFSVIVKRKEREHLSATETLKESAHLSKGGGLSNDISKIIGTLLRDDNRSHLQWLQQLLLEVCYLKSGRYKHVGKVLLPVEPVVFYYSGKTFLRILYEYVDICRNLNVTFLSSLRNLQ